MQIQPLNMELGERYIKQQSENNAEQRRESEKKKTGSLDNFQGHYSHHGQTWKEGSISHTLTHHYNSSYGSHCECLCVCECVYRLLDHCSFQRNRLSFDLSLSSLLWPLYNVCVQVCDHSSSGGIRASRGNPLLHGINHQPLRILTCSQAHFLVQKQHIFLGRDVDHISGWDIAPFRVEWRSKPGVHSARAESKDSHTSRSEPNASGRCGP